MSVTGTVVRIWLRGVRLPITLAESALHRGEQQTEWPAALAFGAFEANVKQLVGTLARDPELGREGRLEQLEVSELRRAATLDAVADEHQREADARLEERLEQDQEQLRRAEQEAESRRQDAARRTDERKRAAEQKASAKEAAAQRAEAETEKSVAKLDRSARTAKVRAEKDAVAKERRAVAADKTVDSIDDELAATKAARKRARS